ncbi:MAG TPA: F0F1 ATP synthase subunit delta [Devosia sp.]|nr:F0F1 ATP synthase subunit delta [Devosia sp.]
MSATSSVLATIARPYAHALFDLATETKNVSAVEKDLKAIESLVGESDDFSDFLRSPLIATDVKSAAIEAIVVKAGLGEMVAHFVQLVARNGRLFVLPAMISAFYDLAAKARDELRAEVTSASPLSKTQLGKLARTLKSRLGKTVTLDTHVDPSLIGGLVVKVGSRMIDSSLKTKLGAMRIAMKEVS